ncbi:hypothetical protein PR048_019414 [Dryococelus australis]|uniref:Uncharacterized protein n=1 Tax=Dryococelus australis TaxID=614101 RepID=A0ABQ9H3R4_9NEOP|nr:hypothetical protein PR048_019414 [Dryococelus australis]
MNHQPCPCHAGDYTDSLSQLAGTDPLLSSVVDMQGRELPTFLIENLTKSLAFRPVANSMKFGFRPSYEIARFGEKFTDLATLVGSVYSADFTGRQTSASLDYDKVNSTQAIPLVGGFSRGSLVYHAPSFRRRSLFTSITLIGSEDLDVKSIPNFFTSLHICDTCLDRCVKRLRNAREKENRKQPPDNGSALHVPQMRNAGREFAGSRHSYAATVAHLTSPRTFAFLKKDVHVDRVSARSCIITTQINVLLDMLPRAAMSTLNCQAAWCRLELTRRPPGLVTSPGVVPEGLSGEAFKPTQDLSNTNTHALSEIRSQNLPHPTLATHQRTAYIRQDSLKLACTTTTPHLPTSRVAHISHVLYFLGKLLVICVLHVQPCPRSWKRQPNSSPLRYSKQLRKRLLRTHARGAGDSHLTAGQLTPLTFPLPRPTAPSQHLPGEATTTACASRGGRDNSQAQHANFNVDSRITAIQAPRSQNNKTTAVASTCVELPAPRRVRDVDQRAEIITCVGRIHSPDFSKRRLSFRHYRRALKVTGCRFGEQLDGALCEARKTTETHRHHCNANKTCRNGQESAMAWSKQPSHHSSGVINLGNSRTRIRIKVPPDASPKLHHRGLNFVITEAPLFKRKSPSIGAAVAERLACSPPTKAIRAQSTTVSTDFRMWESCRTMPLVGGFSRGSPVSPFPSFRRYSILASIPLTGS